MSIYDEYKRTVMYYLKNYNTIKACEDLRREEILNESNFELELSGIHGTKLSDTTAQKALKMAEQNEDVIWLKLIDTVLETYYNEWASKCVKEKFNINGFRTKSEEGNYLDIISEKTYYRYQHEIIEQIARGYVNLIEKDDRKVSENEVLKVV